MSGVELSRRRLLTAGGVAAGGLLLPGRALAAVRPSRTVTLTGTAFGTGNYQYHPFTVPRSVNRLDVRISKTGAAATGLGIFDPRGSHYATLERPNGFRGIYGEERSQFFLATDSASQAFVPGPIHPGEWTVVVPVFQARQPTPYVITVQMSAVPAGAPFRLGRDLHVVLDEPGWYRGDLHAHTPESSDAFNSGSAMTPRQWSDECRRIGLDYLALTDHNVVSQNFSIADSAGSDVLLMAGEEMTNWFYGHATVSGIAPGDWFDWRQLPGQAQTPQAQRDARTGTIQDFIRAAGASGAYVSTAHPLAATLAWRFFGDAAADPAARTDGLEVWTGPFQPDDQAAVDSWDAMNRAGQHVVANGGSDLHGVRNTQGFVAGTPTTVVHADALSKRAVVAALKAGRSFVTRHPSGVELYLSGTLPGQRAISGGTLYGDPGDLAAFEVVVRRAAGMRLVVLRDGAPVQTTPVGSEDERVAFESPVGAGGFVRVEVRSAPTILPATPLASTLDMEALANPVWLQVGSPPPGTAADTTGPPRQAGPRRGGAPGPVAAGPASTRPAGVTSTAGTPSGAAAAGRVAAGPAVAPVAGATLPATGLAGLPTAAAALLAGGLAVRAMTHSEFRLRTAAGAHEAEPVRLTGRVSAARGDGRIALSRWVPGCCSSDAELVVEVDGADAALGEWLEVTGRPDGDLLRAERVERLSEPPPHREA